MDVAVPAEDLAVHSPFRRPTFVFAVVVLSLLCVALREAKADTLGIPFDERFATASFPLAQKSDGCGTWRQPERMTELWGPVDFGAACAEHDLCFFTPGKSWAECNQQFLSDLRVSCERDLKKENLEKGRPGAPDLQAVTLCFEIANLYFVRVQDKEGARRFQAAQKQGASYFDYVKGVIDGIYRSIVKRGATADEKAKALNALAQDYSLDDLKAALMGAKMDLDDPLPAIEVYEEKQIDP